MLHAIYRIEQITKASRCYVVFLLTLDVLELPCAVGLDEAELFSIFWQWLENEGEAQLLVRPGDRGLGRIDGGVVYTHQFLLATGRLFPVDYIYRTDDIGGVHLAVCVHVALIHLNGRGNLAHDYLHDVPQVGFIDFPVVIGVAAASVVHPCIADEFQHRPALALCNSGTVLLLYTPRRGHNITKESPRCYIVKIFRNVNTFRILFVCSCISTCYKT